ncbi:Endonuclease/exonuclease/phosphatase [Microdochium bolleyi]|uniref:Endonuclease/exonuclease/phosphatase n=1 Tax=Microdochium bolleyi TaxID=196109 RepID=A0A136IQU3_9PEZI|nr:Endonuclease/exonuclease/phosphatase [Microdochium bolleyi]
MSPVTFSDNVQRNTYGKPDSPRPWTRGIPHIQPCYAYSTEHDVWQAFDTTQDSKIEAVALDKIEVLSWNIDFMRILDEARMKAALKHLRTHVEAVDSKGVPKVIMLNEMTVPDLRLIQAQDWVRQDYHVTDITAEHWESEGYGTCMLIPKALSIAQVCRIHYTITPMERDALFVDIRMGTPSSGMGVESATVITSTKPRILRLCSTHLESLRSSPPRRPRQLAEAAAYMHSATYAVIGGDMNAIQDFDETLHDENGLKDAYLELGGVEGAEEGMTWGQTASIAERERYGLCRMDKFLFCGEGLEVEHFERFGEDVEVEGVEDRETLIEEVEMEKAWVTDHLGIKAVFSIK